MMDQLRFNSLWWAWWSNPIRQMHSDHHLSLPVSVTVTEEFVPSYFQLLELRTQFSLPAIPDELIASHPHIRLLAIANLKQLESHFSKLAVWSLDSSILHARAQDWQSNYGIADQEQIRQLVVLRNELPRTLYVWHDGFATQLAQHGKRPMFVGMRALIGLGIYLRSFFPLFFSRWRLNIPQSCEQLIAKLEPIPSDLLEIADSWLESCWTALKAELEPAFKQDDIEMPGFGDLDELERQAMAGLGSGGGGSPRA